MACVLLCGCGTVTERGSASTETPTAENTQSPVTIESSGEPTDEAAAPGEIGENGVYTAEGYAAKLNYPLDEKSITYAAMRFE